MQRTNAKQMPPKKIIVLPSNGFKNKNFINGYFA